MTVGPRETAGGKPCQLHYFTGKVLATQKQKETQVSSHQGGTQGNPTLNISSTTVDHHEFFLQDTAGSERSFKMTDLDFPCREGQTVSVIWAIPEGAEEGPYLSARNHNTNDRVVVHPNRIASVFAKPAWMSWVAALGCLIVIGAIVNWIVGIIAVLVPFFFFRWQSRQAAQALLAGAAFAQLEQQLAAVGPLPA